MVYKSEAVLSSWHLVSKNLLTKQLPTKMQSRQKHSNTHLCWLCLLCVVCIWFWKDNLDVLWDWTRNFVGSGSEARCVQRIVGLPASGISIFSISIICEYFSLRWEACQSLTRISAIKDPSPLIINSMDLMQWVRTIYWLSLTAPLNGIIYWPWS